MKSKGFLVLLTIALIFVQISSLCFAVSDKTTGVETDVISEEESNSDTDENAYDSPDSMNDSADITETGIENDDTDSAINGTNNIENGITGNGTESTEHNNPDNGIYNTEAAGADDDTGSTEAGNAGNDSGSTEATGAGTGAGIRKSINAVPNTSNSKAENAAGSTGNTNAGTAGSTTDIGYGAANKAQTPEISAPSAILVEAETGQILYYKNCDAPLHISAANKLMTILVALENGQLSANVTVSSDSVDTEGSAVNLTVGQKYLLSDLLYAIMLTSANDAAVAVAEHISSGDIGKFVEMMNKTAENLGMTNTHFVNPTGLYDEDQYTTARDISKLVRYAVKNPQFSTIFNSKVKLWYEKGSEGKILTSSNNLFWAYDGIRGGKTGYNNKDQQTVICTAARANLQLISIVLDAPEKTMYSDTTALLDYGFNNFWKSTLVSKNEVIRKVEYEGNEVRLISQSDIMYVHPIGESYIKEFEVKTDIKPPLKRTIPAGSAVYILSDGTEVTINLYPDSEIVPVEDVKTRIQKRIVENKDIFLIVAILLVIEALLLLYNVGKLLSRLVSLILRRRRRS